MKLVRMALRCKKTIGQIRDFLDWGINMMEICEQVLYGLFLDDGVVLDYITCWRYVNTTSSCDFLTAKEEE